MKILITDLQPGRNYNLQLRSKSGARVSAWSKTFNLPVPFDVVSPAVPTGLTVDIVGDSFLARWDEVTKDEDGTDIADLSHYTIRMKSVVTGETHELMVGRDTKYELTFNLNVGLFQEPAGIIEFSVAAVDNSWNSSDFCDPVIGANPAPNPVRNLVAKGIMEGITASWDAPEPMEDDFLEYRAYIVLGAEEEITGLNPTWTGNATSFTYSTLTMIDQYVKVVAVDKFGSASTVETAGPVQPRSPNVVDIDAPAVPTDVAGSITGDTMTVSWTPPPNPDNDLAGYSIQYRPVAEDTVGWFMQTATHEDTSVEITVKPFVDYQIRVSAHDFSFNRSGYSAIVDVPGETNLPPAKVTNVEMRAALATAMVFWDENAEPDIKGYEVQFERQTPIASDEVHFTTGTMVSFTEEVDDEVMFYARVRAVDNAGLKGEWSDVASDSIGFPSWVGDWIRDTGIELDQRLDAAELDLENARNRLVDAENALKNADGELVEAGKWIELTGNQLQTNLNEAQQVLDEAFPTGPINVTQLIKTSVVQYAVNSSETTAPTSGWSANTPTRTPGSFIWFRTLITYANNTTTTSSPALLTGNDGAPGSPGAPGQPGQDGQQGDPGAPGVGLTSVTPYFQQKAGAAPAKPTTLNPVAAWSTTEPNWVKDQSLYRTERIVYTDGTFAWTAVSKIASYEGIDAAMAAANGKNKVTYTDGVSLPGPGPAPSLASGTGRAIGDTHRNRTSNGVIVGRWTWSGSAWVQETLASGVMDSLDVGKITGGSAAFQNFVSQNLTSNTGIINDLWTKVVRSQKITTDMLIVGQGENLIIDPGFSDQDLRVIRQSISSTAALEPGWTGAGAVPGAVFRFRMNYGNGALGNLYLGTGVAGWTNGEYPVTAGHQYRLRVHASRNASTPMEWRWVMAVTKTDGTTGQIAIGDPFKIANNDWNEYVWTVPDDVTHVTPHLQRRANVGASGAVINFGSPSMVSMTSASLIVDGAVTAKKITITGDENNPDEAGLVANIASILHLTVDNLYVPGTATIETGIINELWTQVVRSRKITTDMLLVGPGINLVVDPGFLNSTLTDYRLANSTGNWLLATGGGLPNRFRCNPTSDTVTETMRLFSDPERPGVDYFEVVPGETYRIRWQARAGVNGATTCRPAVRYRRFDGTTAYVAVDQSAFVPITTGLSWMEWTWTVPGDVAEASIDIQVRGTGTWTNFASPAMHVNGASLIVDGSIKARAIDIGELVADTAFITKVKADIVKTALIDADQLIAGQGIINDLLIKANLIVSTGGVVKSTNYSSTQGWRLTNNSLVINQGTISAAALDINYGANLLPGVYTDFEGTPASYGSFVYSGGTVTLNETEGRFGNQSLNYSATSGGQSYYFVGTSATDYHTSIEPGETYILSGYFKYVSGVNPVIALRFRFQDASYTVVGPNNAIGTNTTVWKRVSFEFTAPADATNGIPVIYQRQTGASVILVDGLQLERKTGGSSEPSPWSPGSGTRIDGGVIRTGEIRSTTLVNDGESSQPAWSLNTNGGMQVGSAEVRGSLVVGTASTANTSFMQSGVFTASSGWRINADGSAEFRKITVGKNQIDPESISGGNITSPLVIASTLRTSSNNQRAQMDSIGFRYFNSSNVAVFSATGGSVTMKGEVVTSTSANDGIAIKPDSSRLNNGIIEFLSTRTSNPYIAMEAGVSGVNSQLVVMGPKHGTASAGRALIELKWKTDNTSSLDLEASDIGLHSSKTVISGYASGQSYSNPGVAIQARHMLIKSDLSGLDTVVHIDGDLNIDGNINGTMQTYTPTLTATNTNPTGWTRTGRYKRVGQWVWVDISVRATSSFTTGSGAYSISLPVSARATTGATTGQIISGHISNASGNEYAIIGKLEGGASIQRMWTGSGLQVNHGRGWAPDGSININGWYEAA